ncbi:MAG TPA: SpoIID/LytB domain-containing protein [Myxococcota bacterium]
MIAALALVVSLAAPAGLVDDLYAHRLLFDESGRPLVSVGMMQGAARVSLESASGLVITIGEQTIETGPLERAVVEKNGGVPGVVETVQILETLEGEDRAKRKDAAASWEADGVHVELIDVGGVYGVKGTVVDNRAVLVVTAVLDDKARAAIDKRGARPAPFERITKLPTGGVRVGQTRGAAARIVAKDGGAVTVHDVEHGIGYTDHGFADRALRGAVVIVPDKNGTLAVVNLVDEDQLVAGVLPSEMFASAPLEALKAQAVTARGELFAKIGRRHFADPELVCSEQHCQVYKGMSAEQPRATEAALATRGELAFADDKLVDSVYSACCGGHTEAADAVWDRPPQKPLAGRPDAPFADPAMRPWLKPMVEGSAFAVRVSHEPSVAVDLRSDDAVRAFLALPRSAAFCGTSSLNQKGDAWRWTRRFTRAELNAAFADLGVGSVTSLAVDERGPGGRLRSLLVTGDKGKARVLRELPVRKRLQNLRSGLFVIDEERDGGELVAVTLHGAGFGHGAGMCQQGAIGMAEAGYDYQEILRHYYVDAVVRRVF